MKKKYSIKQLQEHQLLLAHLKICSCDFKSNYEKSFIKSDFGFILNDYIFNKTEENSININVGIRHLEKLGTTHEKLNMMFFSTKEADKARKEFEITQDMSFPLLLGEDETKIKYHLDAMILFARSALDYSASIFSCYLLNKRSDSFNNLAKLIKKDNSTVLSDLKEFLLTKEANSLSAYSLLCGTERGRALRDIIAHQTSIKLNYFEYTEIEKDIKNLSVTINNSDIDFQLFIKFFPIDVEEIVLFFEKFIVDNNLIPTCSSCNNKSNCTKFNYF